ncbi:flavodoxin family protein [Luteolibacter ambystomatis]|uniref:Flavodoxin family protein n=1 Tax=Luteolibacter ambystomatis TaxID=2824561 RepID=A0A975IYH6_9BACT|nr:flavodoxin family protein [Luteolibacter ambystomatis]QUE50401.1 flavodoxin family protein [Luteolibacter ambystomatis]
MKTAVVYFSGTGNTAKMAEAVLTGAQSVAGIDAEIHAIEGKDIVEGRFTNEALLASLDAADAIIFGSPTYMGGPAAQFKAFADATASRWFGQGWKDKLAAGFTVSNSPSGDKLGTLQYFQILAAQHGMLWVTLGLLPNIEPPGLNRLGSFGGAMGQAGQLELSDLDKATGRVLGERVASVALKLKA